MKKRLSDCMMRKKDENTILKKKIEIGQQWKAKKKKERMRLKHREIDHKEIASQNNHITPNYIYKSNRCQSDKTQAHILAPPKLSTYDGKQNKAHI